MRNENKGPAPEQAPITKIQAVTIARERMGMSLSESINFINGLIRLGVLKVKNDG